MTRTITRTELQSLLASRHPVTVAEALPPRYYADAHLPGAVNLPLADLETLAPALFPDKAATVVTYCSNLACPNSHQAAERLARLGYTDVRVYAAGKQDWVEAGLPVETGLKAA